MSWTGTFIDCIGRLCKYLSDCFCFGNKGLDLRRFSPDRDLFTCKSTFNTYASTNIINIHLAVEINHLRYRRAVKLVCETGGNEVSDVVTRVFLSGNDHR